MKSSPVSAEMLAVNDSWELHQSCRSHSALLLEEPMCTRCGYELGSALRVICCLEK